MKVCNSENELRQSLNTILLFSIAFLVMGTFAPTEFSQSSEYKQYYGVIQQCVAKKISPTSTWYHSLRFCTSIDGGCISRTREQIFPNINSSDSGIPQTPLWDALHFEWTAPQSTKPLHVEYGKSQIHPKSWLRGSSKWCFWYSVKKQRLENGPHQWDLHMSSICADKYSM